MDLERVKWGDVESSQKDVRISKISSPRVKSIYNIHTMEPFVHFPVQGVVVCSECKHAVLPSHVDAHLKDGGKHKAVKADRERVV
jgi:hypothetical protein